MGLDQPTTAPVTRGRLKRCFKRAACICMAGFAVLFAATILMAFFGVPQRVARWIMMPEKYSLEPPRYIVVMGGGGIPSETGLMRTYYAAAFHKAATGAVIVVSLPSDGDPLASSVGLMREELILRGVPGQAVLMEHEGLDTHEQAANIRKLLPEQATRDRVLLVTSGSHMRRTFLCFRHEGFENLASLAAVDAGPLANTGPGALLRYRFWANLHFEVDVARELIAICWYRVRGWV